MAAIGTLIHFMNFSQCDNPNKDAVAIAIRNVQYNDQGLNYNGKYQLLVYSHANLLRKTQIS